MMKGNHVFCLAPHVARGGSWKSFTLSHVERAVMVLSVAVWKQQNKGIFRLYADEDGFRYLKSIGLEQLYDEINVEALSRMPKKINHDRFWAAGKIYAYRDDMIRGEHSCFIDCDAVLWDAVSHLEFGDVVAAHWEEYDCADFRKNRISVSHHYAYPPFASILKDDGRIKMLNCSFLWLRDPEIAEKYIAEATRYIYCNPGTRYIAPFLDMVHAEQIMLTDVAAEMGGKITVLGELPVAKPDHAKLSKLLYPRAPMNVSGAKSKYLELFASLVGSTDDPLSQRFLHLWGAKQKLKEHPSLASAVIYQIQNKIADLYPKYLPILQNALYFINIDEINKFY